MARIEFEADSLEVLVEMARRWVAAFPEFAAHDLAPDRSVSRAPEGLAAVLTRISSLRTRKLISEVAARSLSGEALIVNGELLERLGVPDRGSFVGVLGVVNRTMRNRAHRDLLAWDPVVHGYRMDADDARVVIDVFGPPASSQTRR
jgi:hypothetical protein